MTIPSISRSHFIVLAACAALLLPAFASAQSAISPEDITEVEIDRDSDTLQDEIRPRPADTDVADTVLVFTSKARHVAAVHCVAFDRSGTPVGRGRLFVPVNGLKFMLASDLSNGADFIGQVVCKARPHVVPTAIFLGPAIENMNVQSRRRGRAIEMRIPLVATY